MREFLPLHHPRVEPSRGAGLWALALIAGGWVTMRTVFIIGDDGEVRLRPFPNSIAASTRAADVEATETIAAPERHESKGAVPYLSQPISPRANVSENVRLAIPDAVMHLTATANSDAPLVDWGSIDRDYMGQLGPLFLAGGPAETPAGTVPEIASNSPYWVGAAAGDAPSPGRFSLYAYLFFRPDAAPGAAATTYGGSQMFVRADWRMGNKGLAQRSSLYTRVSRDLTGDGRAEFAIGGGVQPFANVPITLHGERRVRQRGPDASAAFISGGLSGVPMPHGATLNAYGQGGQVWPDNGPSSQFFDGQASLTKTVHRGGSWRLDAGAMAATGGQDSTARFDIGPVVTVSAGKGRAQVQGQVGWRFRVAGDAAPDNGPAVTLSFGF